MDLKTDFLRGQENAQDDLNENFVKLAEFFNTAPNIGVVVGNEGQVSGSALNGKEIGVGNTIMNQSSDRPIGTVTDTHRLKLTESGTYIFILQAWVQISPSGTDGYWYNNFLVNGSKTSGEARSWGFGSSNWKYRLDGTGVIVMSLVAGDEISAEIETNYSGSINNTGISKLVAIKIA